MSVLGQVVPVKVRYGQRGYQLSVLVVEGKGPNLMGRDWVEGHPSLEGILMKRVVHSTRYILRGFHQ